ncbi:MAG TPA: hypothetical protein VFB12_00505 [Ktedonobacteraceae bacterium]|nr:hypothetical protein [Ktedonobacteraceae bacterium]
MKKAERKQTSLLATLGDLNRPLRVRPVRYMGREWWAIAAEHIWPGMVMDLRRLGFESVAMGEEVLVREGVPALETEMDGPEFPGGLRPFPVVHPTIKIRREAYSPSYSYWSEYEEEEEEEYEEDVVDEVDDDDWGLEDLDEEE